MSNLIFMIPCCNGEAIFKVLMNHGEERRRRCGRTDRWRQKKWRRKTAVACSSQRDVVELRCWMKAREGFRCPLVPAAFTDTGRGLMTKTAVEAGDVILSLPAGLLITTRTVLSSDIAHYIKRWKPTLSPQQALAVYLVWEKQKSVQSLWFPYISVLPESFTTPGYFTPEELTLLPRSVRTRAVQQCDELAKAYSGVMDFCCDEWTEFYKKLTFEEFRWAWFVINTRSVYLKSERSEFLSDEEDHLALAPFLDLLNHSPQASTEAGFNASTNHYQIRTLDKYRRFDQVFISYGPHDNNRLFLEYGFTVPNNPHDVFEFTYDDMEYLHKEFKVSNWERKLQVLRENKLLESLCCSMDGLSWKLWTALRTLAMDWDHLKKWSQLFRTDNLPEWLTALARSMADKLIARGLQGNQKLLSRFNKVTAADATSREHFAIIQCLMTVERDILTKARRTVT